MLTNFDQINEHCLLAPAANVQRHQRKYPGEGLYNIPLPNLKVGTQKTDI